MVVISRCTDLVDGKDRHVTLSMMKSSGSVARRYRDPIVLLQDL